MSSPITSVPEPSSTSGGVASIITQVSPNAPLPGRNTGPARPQKVKAAKKKKEKKLDESNAVAAAATQPTTTATSASEVVSSEDKGKNVAQVDQKQLDQVAEVAKEHAKIQAEAQATGNVNQLATGGSNAAGGVASGPSSQETVTLNDAQKAGTSAQINHTNDPSSTVVGDTTQSDTVSSKEKEEATSTPVQASKDAVTANSTSPKAAAPIQTKTDSTAKPTAASAANKNVKPSTTSSSKQQQQQQTPVSPIKKLIAILTCSSSASAIVASEKKSGEKDSRNKVASGGDVKNKVANGNPTSSQLSEKSAASNGVKTASPNSTTSAAKSKKKKSAAVAGAGAGLAATGLAVSNSTSNNSLSPPRSTNTPRRSLEGAISGSSTPKRGSMILSSGDDDGHSNVNTTPGGGTRIPREETGDVMSAAVVPPGSSFVTEEDQKDHSSTGLGVKGLDGHDEDEDEDESEDEDEELDEEEDEERRLIMQGGIGIPFDENGNPMPLLSELGAQDTGRKCLVLDLDETLVHSSFKAIQNADFIVPVEIEGTTHSVFVIKRPGVDEFMRKMGEIYEVVVFTASLSKYADPVLDILDIHRVVRHRLFRESCYNHKGNYVKDLSQLGRPISESIIIDNSPASYIFHPNNAVPVSSWFNDPHDTELTDLCPFLADLAGTEDVRAVLDGGL